MQESRLLCPIVSAIHPQHESAREEALQWAVAHRLVGPGAELRTFSDLRITEFIARAYPQAALVDSRVVMDWTLWGFLADDEHDALADRPELLRQRYLEHVAVLSGAQPRSESGRQCALADLRTRILQRSGVACLWRFIEAVRDWFEAMHWELTSRAGDRPPPISLYLRMREITVGMYTELALFDVTHQLRTEDSFWTDPDIRRLSALCSNVIAWANDVFSHDKERRARDPNNLVLLLQSTRGQGLRAALDTTISMHNLEMTRFLELGRAVRRRPWPSRRAANAFLELLNSWIRANLDWANASSRYGVSAATRTRAEAGDAAALAVPGVIS